MPRGILFSILKARTVGEKRVQRSIDACGAVVTLREDPLQNAGALRTILQTVKDGVAHTPEEWMTVPVGGAGQR